MSLSPLAYFTHYKTIDQPAAGSRSFNREFRIAAAIEWRHSIAGKIHILHRNAAEYRLVSYMAGPLIRLRYRTGISYTLTNNVRLSLADEMLLYPFHSDITDQIRLIVQVEYTISQYIRIDPGIVSIHRPGQASQDLAFFLNFLLRK